VIWCGDTLPTPVLRHWMTRLPHVRFTNLYGPTETTIASSYYTIPACPQDDRQPIPIGRACQGEQLLLLDDDLRPVPPGETGEISIRGVGLSPGYWRDSEATGRAFLSQRIGDPADRIYRTGDMGRVGPDGLVYFLGRRDRQIKSRGHRIELGEIEAALQTLSSLGESTVVAVSTSGFEGSVVCCAYVPAPGQQVAPSALRRQLARMLPGYMVPSRWKAVDRLPLNPHGKTDRGEVQRWFAENPIPAH
jgi:acyl-coenzyme A synthetase/AMP-(fatty) acid ligase